MHGTASLRRVAMCLPSDAARARRWTSAARTVATVAIAAGIAMATSSDASIITQWIGPASGDWSAAENWSAGAPGPLDTALFALAPTETVVVDSALTESIGRVDGRFYSETFYAPNDAITVELASTMFDYVGEFSIQPPLGTDGLPQIVNSSYALSPSAMWSPKVLSRNVTTGLWYTNPSTLPDGYLSPNVSQCAHPDLKTRMIEHHWNLGAPAPANPAFAGGFTPYFFNHGLEAAPLTLVFDGHVDVLSTAQAVADDAMVFAETMGEVGLWTRDTPYGPNGYYGAQSFDGTIASHHILTAGGILGRDVLSVAAPLPVSGRAQPADRNRPRPIRLDSMVPQAMPIK